MDCKVNIKDMSREEWLEERRKGIGSSDAPVVCGLSKWKDPATLYMEKRGELEDNFSSEAAEWGLILEGVVARKYSEVTGFKVRQDNCIRTHPEFPFMRANLDRIICGNGSGPGILELKTTSAFNLSDWGEVGTDQVPEYYLLQVQHQLAVTGYKWANMAVLIGGQTFRWYNIPRDESLIESLTTIEMDFWRRVQVGDPPPPKLDTEAGRKLLERLYPGTNGEVIRLDDQALYLHETAREAAAAKKEAEAREREAKAQLRAMMREASVGVLPDGTAYTRKLVQRKGYSVDPKEYIDFRFTKNLPKGVSP